MQYHNCQLADIDIEGIILDVYSIDEYISRPVKYLMNSFDPVEIKMLDDYRIALTNVALSTPFPHYGYHERLGQILRVGWKVEYMLQYFDPILTSDDKMVLDAARDTIKICKEDLSKYFNYKLKYETFMKNNSHSMLMKEVGRLLEKNPFGVDR